MPKFELERLTNYDDQSLIAELKRVANLLPSGKLTTTAFNRVGKVHASTFYTRFGSWRKALEVAELGGRFEDNTESWSREEIVEQLKSIAQRLHRNSVTKQELSDCAGISDRPVRRIFGSYRAALEAAGLSQSPGGVRHTDEECYENLLSVWTALGRQPFFREMKNSPSRVGPKAYTSRWGSWSKALGAFVERANRDIPDELPIKPASVLKATVVSPIKRTPRDAPLGLRYKVLRRDRFRCVIDGKSPATHPVTLHVDHITPWSKGGETVIENLRTLCSDCNLGKGASFEHD